MKHVLLRQRLIASHFLRGFFFGRQVLSSLGEDALGGLLILGYQKSSPTQYTLTQTANSSHGALFRRSTLSQKKHHYIQGKQ